MKRILVFSDPHCGSLPGLTPPAYQVTKTASRTKRGKWAKLTRETWREYIRILDTLKPFDAMFFMGDGIDGTGHRSGGTELITTDREEQVQMCVDCITQVRVRARKGFEIIGVYGTPYHSGTQEDFENSIADKCGFQKIGSHEWVDVDGVVFDLKHHIGTSSVPYGRNTAIARDQLWNKLWSIDGTQPSADVVLRGHAHYFEYGGDSRTLRMVLPALQAMGTKYGARRCSGRVDWGVVHFDVNNGQIEDWNAHVIPIESQKAAVVKL
jgi:hypothetical protein